MGIVLEHLTQNSCYQTLWKPLWYPPLKEAVKWVKGEIHMTCLKIALTDWNSYHIVSIPKSVSFNFFAIIARNSSKSISPAENHIKVRKFNSTKCTVAIDIHLFDHILEFLKKWWNINIIIYNLFFFYQVSQFQFNYLRECIPVARFVSSRLTLDWTKQYFEISHIFSSFDFSL